MRRRVVLVDFPWSRDKDPRLSLGHASLLTALRTKSRADVRSLVLPVNRGGDAAESAIEYILYATRGLAPHAVDVAIGVYVWCEEIVQTTLAGLRGRGFEGRIVLGGPQISYAGEGVYHLYPGADLFVRGYGEDALCALSASSEYRPVIGVYDPKRQLKDPVTQAQVSLESLPSPWLTGAVDLSKQPFVRWETQRGCPFRCSFCQHREPGQKLKKRRLEEARIRDEIELFCERGVNDIAVLDPIFNDPDGRATAILEEFVARNFRGRLSLQCRAELIDDAFLDAAALVGARLELGIQTVVSKESRAIRRNNDMKLVSRALEGIQKRGIDHEVSIIFGLPEQTLESFQRTISFCLLHRIPVIRAFPLMLLRGTELERRRDEWQLRDDGSAMPMVISSTSFDAEDWYRMARLAEALKQTERQHPKTIDELSAMAPRLRPSFGRYQPAPKLGERHYAEGWR